MSRLAEQIQLTLDELGLPARTLEVRAGLPHMTVRGIVEGSHPRSERFDRLLAAIPRLDLRISLVTAYILDDCPASEVGAVEAILREHLMGWHTLHDVPVTSSAVVSEPEATYRATPSKAALARVVLDKLRAAVDNGDSELSHWLATTGNLLTTPHLPPTNDAD